MSERGYYNRCGGCGAKIMGDEWSCPECDICQECGKYGRDFEKLLDGETYCPDCIDRFPTCENCGEVMPNEDCDNDSCGNVFIVGFPMMMRRQRYDRYK